MKKIISGAVLVGLMSSNVFAQQFTTVYTEKLQVGSGNLITNVVPSEPPVNGPNGPQNNNVKDYNLTTQGYVDKEVNGAVNTANAYTDTSVKAGVGQANTYTDTQIASVNGRINGIQNQVNDVARTAYSGIAGAAALSQVQIAPGKDFAIGIGAANFRGYSAGAVGIAARINENLQVRGGYTNNGIAAGGLSYSW